jgi:Peptidase family M23
LLLRELSFCATGFLTALHVSLALALHWRIGVPGVVLWYVGPSLLAALAALVLLLALISAIRRRQTWSQRRVTALTALSVLAVAPAFYRVYPSSHDKHPSPVRFELPLDGPITVAWGGEAEDVNAHVYAPDQRWGYDLIVTQNGRSSRGDRQRLTSYFIYGRTVLAPAAGIVVAAHNAEPDVPIGEKGTGDDLGNHVALEVAPAQFLFIAHMQPGSIAVRRGDRVAPGQSLGRVGNSGISSEPHVHIHLQDSGRRHLAEGIPFFFSDYCAGSEFVRQGMPRGGRENRHWVGDVISSSGCGESHVVSLIDGGGSERFERQQLRYRLPQLLCR